ncbi:hypothetical protein I5590_09010 [Acinetobacter baumannii]|nr:hypothetical protein [Acinetobacter baumannii]EKY1320200.1 hypothetical protein [Acinetobacter baumannii]EKY1522146.1 hypothetical protein [Acinetobacter baumannii]MBE2425640.1 hypothetical protein [Acinetobacter baumannii]MBE2489922.1 hypothetical protein [Acinetobacter baumannii]MBJ9413922.1 hypothetical protein [Acinetobacter baumannii]
MKFFDVVSIEQGFKRSVNLKSDQENLEILNHYLCSKTAEFIISSMLEHITVSKQSAFTWTGPYGSGKSSLALFLSSLISRDENLKKIAKNKLSDKSIINFFDTQNWNLIPIIGRSENIINILAETFNVKANSKDILEYLEKKIAKKNPTVIIFDEMGKSLEAIASKNNSDIYILQEIAELANRSAGNLIFIGILHQSLNEYARNLPRNIKNEWLKIHGRFIDLSVNTAGEEQIHLISRAIQKNINIPSTFEKSIDSTIKVISKNKPINSSIFKELLKDCWPIHPIVISLLGPVSRKRFSQNQRSIFSFLSSVEPFGFQYFINNYDYDEKVVYTPSLFWDYLQCNFENSILASSDAKIWIVAQEAISKSVVVNASPYTSDILKTISLVEIFRNTSGLLITSELLKNLFPYDGLDSLLNELVQNSIIRFNKYSKSFHLYEGSDFNIDEELDEAYKAVNTLDIKKLNEIANFKPIIAKRHYHQTGCMRWLNVELFTLSQLKSFNFNKNSDSGEFGKFIIILPKDDEEFNFSKNFLNKFPQEFNNANNYFLGVIEEYALILDYLKELLALNWLSKNCAKLAGDRIARKEVENRTNQVLSLLSVAIGNIIVNINWKTSEGDIGYLTEGAMSSYASNLADQIYYATPILKTEMLNRKKPSANANAALNILLKHMVKMPHEPKLGIQGFPAEGGLYRILLENTNLHIKVNKEFKFSQPLSNQYNLMTLWDITDNFLKSIDHNVTVHSIYNLWSLPPLGIKKGLYVFLMATYLLTRKAEVAVYLNGRYFPEINDLFIDYLTKETSNIEVRYIQRNSQQQKIISTLLSCLTDLNLFTSCQNIVSPLEISRALVQFIDRLNPWTLRTKTLDNNVIKFRDILKKAHDPNKLIFDEISLLFNFDNTEEAIKDINFSLNQLLNAYTKVINEFKKILFNELQVKNNKTGIKNLVNRAKNISNISGDYRVNAFATRISMLSDSTDIDFAIEGLMSLTINKPTSDWIDLDIEKSKIELAFLCNEFRRTELYAHIKGKPVSRHAINIITGLRGSNNIYEASIEILDDQLPLVETIKKDLRKAINNHYSSTIILAALSELGADYMELLHEKDELISEES